MSDLVANPASDFVMSPERVTIRRAMAIAEKEEFKKAFSTKAFFVNLKTVVTM